MKNKKTTIYFIVILLIISLMILVIIFFYTTSSKLPVSDITSKRLCKNTGGTWIERGTDEECKGLDMDECSKNPNCMGLMVPVGPQLPAFRFGGCKQISLCECPNEESFYSDGGCKR